MYDKAQKKLEKRVRRLVRRKKIIVAQPVYIFGINEGARVIIRELAEFGITVRGILENDTRKQHLCIAGVPSLAMDDVPAEDWHQAKFLIFSSFWREMVQELYEKGVQKQQIRVLSKASWLAESLVFRLYFALRGGWLYRRIRRRFPRKRIFVCPYTGTGDAYLVGTLLPQYLAQEHLTDDDFVMVVVSKACEKVTRLFHMKHVVRITTDDCARLMAFYRAFPDDCTLEVFNDSWGDLYTNEVQWLRGFHGMDFTQMFQRFVFRLPLTARPQPPVLDDVSDRVEALFAAHHLVPGCTVVLSPYSNTLADLPMTFWERAAAALQGLGLVVCTNSGGPKEPAVAGTEAVFFPLDIAPQVITCAGGFLGVRSGFCDIISCATAVTVVLYDQNNYFYHCPAIDYFSLRTMGLSEDAIELTYDVRDLDALLGEIVACFRERMIPCQEKRNI